MSRHFKFHITQEEAGLRLDEFLASRFGWLSRMRIAGLIAQGACALRQGEARAGHRIAAGEVIEVALGDQPPTAMTPEPIPLEILHEDDYILVVVKPAGMLVHPTKSIRQGTLANALAYHLNRFRIADCGLRIDPRGELSAAANDSQSDELQSAEPQPDEKSFISQNPQSEIRNPKSVTRPGLAHRLDRATSGLMVVAKTPRALSVLSSHFSRRLVEKRYLAVVRGHLREDAGEIIAPIGRDPDRRPQWGASESGKPAETRFQVVKKGEGVTLLELEPVTGRTNQLRIHCAFYGHPIVGDEIYGDDNIYFHSASRISEFESQGRAESPDSLSPQADEARASLPNSQSAIRNPQSEIRNRLCLHASRLAFHHPAGGRWMQFTSPLPADIASLIDVEEDTA